MESVERQKLVLHLEMAISLLKIISEHHVNHPYHGDHKRTQAAESVSKTLDCGIDGHCLRKPQQALGFGHASQEDLQYLLIIT